MPILVSIIIPVYNVSDYVEECLQSVTAQTYTAIECIIVDDCGTDDSMQKVESFITNYQGPITFKILHHEHNRGLSAARNTGIDAAQGEYIYFIDSDDYIYHNSIEILVASVSEDEEIDWAFGAFERSSAIGIPRPKFEKGIYKNVLDMRSKRLMYPMACNYLIKRDFLRNHNLRFVEGLLHEDNLWTFQIACYGRKMAFCEDITYHYRIRDSNITTMDFSLRYPHFFTIHHEMIRFVYERNLYNRKDVLDCVSQDIKGYFCLAFYNRQGNLSYDYYHVIRENPYLNLRQIWALTHSVRQTFVRFHRYMPKPIGYFFLWSMFRPLNWKELLYRFFLYYNYLLKNYFRVGQK